MWGINAMLFFHRDHPKHCSFCPVMVDGLMQMLFKEFPDGCHALKLLTDGAMSTGSSARWATEWEGNALPLIDKVSFMLCAVLQLGFICL